MDDTLQHRFAMVAVLRLSKDATGRHGTRRTDDGLMTPSTLYVSIFLVLDMVKSKGTSGYVEQWPGMWINGLSWNIPRTPTVYHNFRHDHFWTWPFRGIPQRQNRTLQAGHIDDRNMLVPQKQLSTGVTTSFLSCDTSVMYQDLCSCLIPNRSSLSQCAKAF